MVSAAVVDAAAVVQACRNLINTDPLQQCWKGGGAGAREAFIHNTQRLAQLMPSLASLHPALQRNDGLDWSLDYGQYCLQWDVQMKRDKELQSGIGIKADEAPFEFPTPYSILRTFPPAPSDPAQWSESFYPNCCPVRPRLPVLRGLLSATHGSDMVHKNEKKKVVVPEAPAAGASAQEVAGYVCRAEAQLGPAAHAVTPIAAAITQTPWPWVSDGER
jgi:hypothetical protein